jgi:hypothetical protein
MKYKANVQTPSQRLLILAFTLQKISQTDYAACFRLDGIISSGIVVSRPLWYQPETKAGLPVH